MPQFAANLSVFYTDLPFLQRFEAAAKDGFKAVGYLFFYAFKPLELAARLAGNGLHQVLFNAPPGGVDAATIEKVGTMAAARARPACRGARRNFKPGLSWRCAMHRLCSAHAFM